MIPRISDTAASPLPLFGAISDSSGSRNAMPKKPYTTDGMPASRSTTAENAPRSLTGHQKTRKTAVKYPLRPPTSRAPSVAAKVPAIIGRIP